MDSYVSTSGSDTTGTGASSAPYRSIAKALSELRNGNRVIIQPGDYVEAVPLQIDSLEQARILTTERGSTTVRIGDGVAAPAVLTLLDCNHCVVDGLTLANREGDGGDVLGGVRVRGGSGNLLSDVGVSWNADDIGASAVFSAFDLARSPNSRIRRCSVRDTVATWSGAGGTFCGFRISDMPAHLVDSEVRSARVRGGAIARGILIEGSTGASTVRVERTSVVDLETWTTAAAPVECMAMRVDTSGSGVVKLVGREIMLARPHAVGMVDGSLTSQAATGLWVACQDAVEIDGFIGAWCSVGMDFLNVPNPSVISRLTLHQCERGIRSTAPTPPSRFIVRNASFSSDTRVEPFGMGIGIEAVGLPGETFFDLDFVNFYGIREDWLRAADPIASSFEIGPHVTEFNPMYTDPENLDFTPTNVSGLVNRGGDL